MYKNDSMKENHYELRIKKRSYLAFKCFWHSVASGFPLGDLELFYFIRKTPISDIINNKYKTNKRGTKMIELHIYVNNLYNSVKGCNVIMSPFRQCHWDKSSDTPRRMFKLILISYCTPNAQNLTHLAFLHISIF